MGGIKGAALATAIGEFASFILTIAYFFRAKTFHIKFKDLVPDFKNFKSPFMLGISSFMNQMTIVIINLVGNIALVKYGNLSIYGQDIPISIVFIETKVSSLVLSVVIGLALRGQPIVVYNLGAGNTKRIKRPIF